MCASVLTDLILNKNAETKPDVFLMYTLSDIKAISLLNYKNAGLKN